MLQSKLLEDRKGDNTRNQHATKLYLVFILLARIAF